MRAARAAPTWSSVTRPLRSAITLTATRFDSDRLIAAVTDAFAPLSCDATKAITLLTAVLSEARMSAASVKPLHTSVAPDRLEGR